MAHKRVMKKEILIAASLIAVLSVSPAFAYLDPSSGAAITSAILGFFAAIAFTARKYFHRVVRLFTGKAKKDKAAK